MAFLEWEEKYSVCNDSIDADHKALFGLINDLYKAMAVGQGPLAVREIMRQLLEYAKYHFAEEEKLMAEAYYEGLAFQREQHHYYIEQLAGFVHEFTKHDAIVHIDIAVFLKNWITNHVLKVDAGLKSLSRFAPKK